MMTFYIDTSSSYLYTGVVSDNKLVCSINEKLDHTLSELALSKIANMFKENHINPNDIEKIVAVNGPGSFTGIRVGLTIAKVYAWAKKLPITCISSLEAMAISCDTDLLKIPVIDARNGFVYGAIYKDNKEVLIPQHIKLIDLYKYIDKECLFITNDDIEIDGKIIKYIPDIVKIVEFSNEKEDISPHEVNPIYLKRTAAEENKK